MPKQNSNSYDFNSRTLDQKGLRAREDFLEAVAKGEEEKLALIPLEDQRAFVNYRDPRSAHSRRTALMYASLNGHENMARHLIALGADPDMKDSDGWSALTFAVAYNRQDIAGMLLDAQADINSRDNEGWTPLMEAIGRDSQKIALFLIERGADVTPRNNEGMTALEMSQDLVRNKVTEALLPIVQKLDTDAAVDAMRAGTSRKVSAPAPAKFRKAG